MLLLLLLANALALPLGLTNIYIQYMNDTSFIGENCKEIRSIDNYTLFQKCQVEDSINIVVNGTHNTYVFLVLYTVDPHSKPFKELYRYSYGFVSYHMITARIDKFGQDYLLTSSSQRFTDGTPNKTANYVHLSLILGFQY